MNPKYIYSSLEQRGGIYEFAFLEIIGEDKCCNLFNRRIMQFPKYQYLPIKISDNLYLCRIQMSYRGSELVAVHLNDNGELHRVNGPAVTCSHELTHGYRIPALNEYYLNGVCLSEVDQAFVFDNFPDEKLKSAIFNLDRFSKKGE